MDLRYLMKEYILFAFSDEELMEKFHITQDELDDMADIDLLEIYDQTLLSPVQE